MTQDKQNCSIIFIGDDLEWIYAFEKGVQRFFVLSSSHSEGPWDTKTLLENARADIVVLTGSRQPQDMEVLRPIVHNNEHSIPVIVVDVKPVGLDKWIRQGAEFAVARSDILTAVKNVKQIMQLKRQVNNLHESDRQLNSLKDRYQRIYQDLADPVAYVQDGLFLEANPAFYRIFGVENQTALEELTLMNLVPRKSEKQLKTLLKNALEKDLVPTETIELQTLADKRMQMQVRVSKLTLNKEVALQLYCRDTTTGGGSESGLDQTTGLGSAGIMASILEAKRGLAQNQEVLGYWTYLWIENYRDVWQKDGIDVAEILMGAVSEHTQRFVPANTDMVRFTDDALVLWLTGDKEENIARIKKLIAHLDHLIPENIGRLIHPTVYVGMLEISAEASFSDLASKSFRAVRTLALSQSTDRIAEPMSGELSRKDERRMAEIETMIANNQFDIWYQPIALLEPDGVPRFSDVLRLKDSPSNVSDETEPATEFDTLMQVADRYGLARKIDRLKIDLLLQDILSYDGRQDELTIYLSVSADSLNDPEFAQWVLSQLQQTGISPSQIVFELSVDAVIAAYSGSTKLVETMRPKGANFALTHIGRIDEEIKSLLSHLSPEVLKIDMREIDTFEDEEESRFMNEIKAYETEHDAMIIAAEMDSPAQLSHVWPYDIQFIQGDGMVPATPDFHYNFNEPPF